MLTGNLKVLVLRELKHHEATGYQLMKAIQKLSGEMPSPGSIYPLLTSVQGEGLVSMRREGKRKWYRLTGDGCAAVRKVSAQREAGLMGQLRLMRCDSSKPKGSEVHACSLIACPLMRLLTGAKRKKVEEILRNAIERLREVS